MARIVIEGSNRPSAYLARGERAEVQDSPHVQRLIKAGYVIVVNDDTTPTPASAPVTDAAPTSDPTNHTGHDAPPRNASREAWAYFLETQGVKFNDDDTRDVLISLWEQAQTQIPMFDNE